jgi:Flp pilus assembly protein TadB
LPGHTLACVKEFVVYTAARVGLFVASLLVFFGIFAAFGVSNWLWPVVLAALVSAVASYYLLQGPRERFAARVESRASAMSQRFEEARAKEDED